MPHSHQPYMPKASRGEHRGGSSVHQVPGVHRSRHFTSMSGSAVPVSPELAAQRSKVSQMPRLVTTYHVDRLPYSIRPTARRTREVRSAVAAPRFRSLRLPTSDYCSSPDLSAGALGSPSRRLTGPFAGHAAHQVRHVQSRLSRATTTLCMRPIDLRGKLGRWCSAAWPTIT